MPFIPHTEQDVQEMLAAIGAPDIESLFEEIPAELRVRSLAGVPEGLNEQQVMELMYARARQDGRPLNFIGAGAYEHHVPAAVWAIVSRGEFYSAYTPYQAEASQGTLQTIYEYQSMITALTGLQVANASLYDGATAVAEACLMAVRANRRSSAARVLVPRTVHPHYRAVTQAATGGQGLKIEELPYLRASGQTAADALPAFEGQDVTAVVIQQPNFFGVLEDVDALTDWAHARGALVIAVVNPISLAVLKPPSSWGQRGEDRGGRRAANSATPWRPVFWLHGDAHGLRAADARHRLPHRRPLDGRSGFTLTRRANSNRRARPHRTSAPTRAC
jgi:glycine dehydrogenase subunit 1